MTELLPCPFCGGEAEYGITFAGEEVYCKKCHAAMPRVTTEAEAIKTWNTRAERTCHEVLVGKFFRGCSECGYMWEYMYGIGKRERPNYCPNCGRKVES